MYLRGGCNVYPTEVEAVLAGHPAVASVAVAGLPDPVPGQIGAAFVVVAPWQPPGLDELRVWCLERLADYKAPDELYVVGELPLTAMAKVDERALVALATEELPR